MPLDGERTYKGCLVKQAKIMARFCYDWVGESSVAFIDKALKLHQPFTFSYEEIFLLEKI